MKNRHAASNTRPNNEIQALNHIQFLVSLGRMCTLCLNKNDKNGLILMIFGTQN